MAQIDDAHEIDGGLSLNEKALIYHTATDPDTGGGFEAPIGSLLLDTVSGALWRKVGPADTDWTKFGVSQFGLELFNEKDATQSTTTSTTFVTKLSLVTPSLDSGEYRIGWNSLVGNIQNQKESEYQFLLNGTTVIESMYIQSVKNEFDQVFTGFTFQTLSGITTFELQHRAVTGESRIEETSIEFWKVL